MAKIGEEWERGGGSRARPAHEWIGWLVQPLATPGDQNGWQPLRASEASKAGARSAIHHERRRPDLGGVWREGVLMMQRI
jgi:hypothetical protein